MKTPTMIETPSPLRFPKQNNAAPSARDCRQYETAGSTRLQAVRDCRQYETAGSTRLQAVRERPTVSATLRKETTSLRLSSGHGRRNAFISAAERASTNEKQVCTDLDEFNSSARHPLL
jgi:hypothetical protein